MRLTRPSPRLQMEALDWAVGLALVVALIHLDPLVAAVGVLLHLAARHVRGQVPDLAPRTLWPEPDWPSLAVHLLLGAVAGLVLLSLFPHLGTALHRVVHPVVVTSLAVLATPRRTAS